MPKMNTEIADDLKTIAEHFDKEDTVTRERQIRHWRRLKLYWNSFSQVYWSETAHDYRIYGWDNNNRDNDQDYYDRPVNVFKAFLETIIAALSIQIPAINCVPDDATNPSDISTSKAGDKIAELVYKHNNVMFLWLNALYIYCTEGMIGCRTYSKEDKAFGTYDKEKWGEEEVESYVCPYCQSRVPDFIFSNNEMNEFAPDEDDSALHSEIEEEGPTCMECGAILDPQLQKTKLIVPRIVGVTKEPKSRICLECYGGLYIKIANYAKKQSQTPYLTFSHETHYANVLECYPDMRDEIPHGQAGSPGTYDPYEQYGRLNTQYRGEFPNEVITLQETWLRPAAFNVLDEDKYKKLKKMFPDGVCVVRANDTVCDYYAANLDDEWTLTKNPMSDYLTHEPLGELLTNIQDITNDLISLTLQTIEHGIAQTWADPAVVNFNAQRQVEAMPGTLTATKPVPGAKNISEAFHTTSTASLSPEVFNFYQIVQQLGQFVSGALPSLFGGAQGQGSSGTASEYAMAKGMALQRLQTPWKMLTIWWKDIFGKVIPLYMKNMQEDERFVEKDDLGNFINVFLRKAEMTGSIGSIELEADEKLPITDEQQADIIMQLFNLNNDQIVQALMDPENLPFIAKIVKIPSFRLPGGEDRQKQLEEIVELVNSIPIPQPPTPEQQQADAIVMQQTGTQPEPIEQPSVEVDPDIDNHEIEAAICRSWLIGPAGRLAKVENPDGYRNVMLHMKAHLQIVQQQMLAQAMQQQQQAEQGKTSDGQGKPPNEKPKRSENIKGAKDARTPVS
jgi:hypothetical protein